MGTAGSREGTPLVRRAAQASLALMMAGALVALPGCGANAQGSGTVENVESTVVDEVTSEAEEALQETVDEVGEQTEVTWERYCEEKGYDTDLCFDRNGDPTAYALWVLPGKYLDEMLKEQGFVWSERSLMWIKENGSVAVLAMDGKGKPVSKEKLMDSCPLECQTSKDAFAKYSYRISTSKFSNPKKTYDAIVGRVLDVSDVELADESGVGVFCVPRDADSMTDANLAFVNTRNGVRVVSLFTGAAVENGLFAKLSGHDLGSTPEEVFEALAGRAPELGKAS